MRKSIIQNKTQELKKNKQRLENEKKSNVKQFQRPKLTRIQIPKTKPKEKENSLEKDKKKQQRNLVQMRQIRALQRNQQFMIQKQSFRRVIRQIDEQVSQQAHLWQPDALIALQYAAEDYMTSLFEDAFLCTQHRLRTTLMLKDIRLARRIRGRADPGNR